MEELLEKYKRLTEYLKTLGSCAAAFSGGTDSAFLLYAAKEALNEKAIAITASSVLLQDGEVPDASRFCQKIGVKHLIMETDVWGIDGFKDNPPERCYICKKAIFEKIKKTAAENGCEYVAEGSNIDDTGDYRPGMRAIKELGVLSPLMECGFSKEEIRTLSRHFGLETWDKVSSACLASRIPYYEQITPKKLCMADKGEKLLKELGFEKIRVRVHGDLARIETSPEEFDRFNDISLRENISRKFNEYGFLYTSVDIIGYRTGSLNEALKVKKETD